MVKNPATRVLTCPPSLHWVKDSSRILIIDERLNTLVIVQGAESAVWDWLISGYDIPDLIDLIAAFCDESQAKAETHLLELLQNWVSLGILTWEGEENG